MNDKINCARCNSEQKFVVHLRPVAGRSWKEAFIKCYMCRWETVMYLTNDDIETTKTRLKKVQEHRIKEELLQGRARAQTIDLVQRFTKRLVDQERNLRREVDRVGSPS